jgi:hypothetical protein
MTFIFQRTGSTFTTTTKRNRQKPEPDGISLPGIASGGYAKIIICIWRPSRLYEGINYFSEDVQGQRTNDQHETICFGQPACSSGLVIFLFTIGLGKHHFNDQEKRWLMDHRQRPVAVKRFCRNF